VGEEGAAGRTCARPLRVALTGGIATGKSYVRARFQDLGIPTIDSDTLAREVVRTLGAFEPLIGGGQPELTLFGGTATLLGPFVGAGVFIWMRDFLSKYLEYWEVFVGGAFVLIVLFLPDGIVGSLTRLLTRRRPAPDATAEDALPDPARLVATPARADGAAGPLLESRGLTKTFALETGPHNINVNCVAPGMVEGPRFFEKVLPARAKRFNLSIADARKQYEENYALRRISTGEDVANAVVFLVSERSRQITGVDLPVDGGWASL